MSWRKVLLTALCGLLLVASAPPARAQGAPEIVDWLSNFDVRNTGEVPYDDFELQLLGRIGPRCIAGFYPGWGAPPEVREGTPFGPGVTLVWRDPRRPVAPGRSEHFGVRLRCGEPIAARGFWSLRGRPMLEVPLPWQSWQGEDGVVVDVIRLPREIEPLDVLLRREFVTLPEPIPLERLNWGEVDELVARQGRDWIPYDERPVPIGPGEQLLLKIPAEPDDRAALVRYTVSTRREVAVRFVNQAELKWPAGPQCYRDLPDPVVEVTGSEDYVDAFGNPYTRYDVRVTNHAAYPDALFAASPSLPPCGTNPNAARTWVDLNDGDGNYLYGFCALSGSASLENLWFGLPRGTPPPECVSVTLTDRACEMSWASDCAPITGLGPACIDFEDPALGSTYLVGDSFVDSGATIRVTPFQWSGGTWTSGGNARIDNAGNAGASGQEVWVNNVNLDFGFPALPSAVHFNFGEYGGNLNLEVNGDHRNFQNFSDVHGLTIGGVAVSVSGGFGNDTGTVLLSGEVNTLAVGGQELAVDRVCHTDQPGVDAEGVWVLPWGVGGTRLDRIQPDGLTDYTDSGSGHAMMDAPFGGRLGFRLGASNVVPTPGIYYYRFLYRLDSTPDWTWATEFDEPVAVHYVLEDRPPLPFDLRFPLYSLGPHSVSGMQLYRFRPHQAELPSLVPVGPNQEVYWPNTGFLGDIYNGFLETVGDSLAPGRYLIKVEVYDSGGSLVPHGTSFDFRVPTGVQPDGTIDTDVAPPASIDAGGVVFALAIDNRDTSALIDEPMLGGAGAGSCGFLRYDPADPENLVPVEIAFHANHPADHAVFSFTIHRGPNNLPLAQVSGADITVPTAGVPGILGPYNGDGSGNFDREFTRGELLGPCVEAAFAQRLYVFAKVTRGWGHRIAQRDSSFTYAFALTPE